MLPKIILLMGNQNAGKGTVAQYLADKFHYSIKGFADPLYEQLAILNPWIQVGESLTTPKFRRYNDLVAEFGVDYTKRNFQEVRTYLQRLGTECGRQILGQRCWVDIAAERSRGDYRTVFYDTRFPNEVDWGRTEDSLFVWVTSPRETPAGEHVSEHSIDYSKESDYHLHNDSDLEALYGKMENILDQWAAHPPTSRGIAHDI